MTFNKVQALQEAQRALAQGKLSQAIREYLTIIEHDPSDLSLLNTVGDLCVRDNNVAEALRLFRQLAEAYVREGFILRAIAIYKKIIKLDPNAVEPLLKLAELYADQRLSREARDLYAQALALCQRDNQKERAIEVMRKMVSSEPANKAHLLRLAECCLAIGRTNEALKAYLDGAESALGEGDTSSATVALDQAAAINPLDPRLAELRRRLSPEAVPEPVVPEATAEVAELPPTAGAPPATGVPEGTVVPQAEERPAEGLPAEAGTEAGLAPVAEAAPEAAAVEMVPEPAVSLREPDEFDLSGEWEVVAASQVSPEVALPEAVPPEALPPEAVPPEAAEVVASQVPLPVPEVALPEAVPPEAVPPEAAPPTFDFEEAAAEIDFYLNYGLAKEAQKSVARLEEKFPGDPQVAELRRRVETEAAAEIAGSPVVPSAPAPEPIAETPVIPSAPTPEPIAETPVIPSAPAPEPIVETPVIPSMPAPGPIAETPVIPSAPAPKPIVETPVIPSVPAPSPIEDLAKDLESSWIGMDSVPEKQAAPSMPAAPVTMPDFAVSLGALLGELGSEPGEVSREDSQTHYQLGVAFREMGLIEEAIGEFQKVVRTVRRGAYPPEYLAACSLLGLCFMDKQLPKLAVNWYTRALECPSLDPEAALALEYDLGAALEQAGDLDAARERFLQVYSQNVDYRDVAEKIRQLAGKP